MLEAMRNITLIHLQDECGLPIEKAIGLKDIREVNAGKLNEMLVEAAEKIEQVYILSPSSEENTVQMTVSDIKDIKRLPFNKPTGSQSSAIGPVIKRSFTDKKLSPSQKIQNSTQKYFEELSKENKPWSKYFGEVVSVLSASKMVFNGQAIEVGDNCQYPSILAAAISLIPEKKNTVFLTVADKEGSWPGDRKEYQEYLAQVLASEKYLTSDAPIKENGECPLCGENNISLYPNGLKGAGLNLSNMDREGAFPSLRKSWSWKSYALCLDCADSLYIFKNHLMKNFITRIAGAKCLVLADLVADQETRFDFIDAFKKYIDKGTQDNIASHERDLLEFFKDQKDSSLVLHIIWATFGQVVEKFTGVVTEILPSRLNQLSQVNRGQRQWQHVLAPTVYLDETEFDLGLNFLHKLFERPGGKRTEKLNSSVRLFEIKRALVSAIYRGDRLDNSSVNVFWKEILQTAQCYLEQVNQSGIWLSLIQEKLGDKPAKYLTLAGWVRHLARFLSYLSIVEVYSMQEVENFNPEMEALKPYFAKGSGIDSLEKAFAFLLGVLFGKLIQVQAAKGVNVGANALTWLKRLNLTGRDLPELYVKIREKLLAYETEASHDIQLILKEIAYLGIKLGDKIQLDNVSTCYFLLLGQSMTTTILPAKKTN
ncbi:MAG: CRISPR-associated protein [Acidobacteria bacterium]|nr:CRISPR-associated protein [Acidobacteriota bacterium]